VVEWLTKSPGQFCLEQNWTRVARPKAHIPRMIYVNDFESRIARLYTAERARHGVEPWDF